MKKQTILSFLFLLPAVLSMGAGYQLNLQGLRQLAMGGGGVAQPWDAATLFYNPGGLSRLDGIQVNGSILGIIPATQYVNDVNGVTARTQNKVFTPFNLYVGGAIKKAGGLGVGVGVYTPFGSGTYWENGWTGRYAIQNIELQTIFIQPTVSYKITDAVSVGVGVVIGTGNVKLNKAIPVQDANGNDGQASLKGKANGLGYNVGLSFKASDNLHFGVSYRSRVDMHAKDGDATFKVASAVAANFPNTKFDATLPCPEVLSVGAAWKPFEKFTVQLDFNLTGWNAYDTLAFNYSAPVNGSSRTASARLYQNRLATRLGANYQATERLALMIGGAYDPSPVRDGYVSPDLPDANRIVLTGGLTYRPLSKLTLMAAVEYVTSAKRHAMSNETGFGGLYQNKAFTPGIGVAYDF
ncbi:MAG: outer membrane protein transport protein [Bacteroidetes bacterium]|nr:outer membrane protein transport protein [Bacteroidota bacterium]